MTSSWLQKLTREFAPGEGSANLFGVILYTHRHVYVAKMLADDHYCKALNELSGTRWNVFAARGEAGDRGKGFLRSVWKEPEANKELLEQFDLKSTDSFPALMIYAEDAQGGLHKQAYSIKGDSEAEVFKSLSDTLTTIAATLNRFLDENLRVETRAFDVATEQLDGKKQWETMKKIPGIFITIKDLVKKLFF